MTRAIYLAIALLALTPAAHAANDCAKGKTLAEGKLTIATGNPAYAPWVIDDKPQNGKGYEAALAYDIAQRMGFDKAHVVWVRTGFDQAIQPGAKDFDLNIQQFSITAERQKTVDFSAPYYTSTAAIVVRKKTVEAGTKASKASLAKLRWGAAGGTTAGQLIATLIAPKAKVMVYDDTADITAALKADQIDAALFDLPTALYVVGAELDDGVVLGQYSHTASGNLDQFGAVMAKESALRPCVDAAIEAATKDGTLKALETKWLQGAANVPVIKD